jgi:sulfatase modifying factor 1
MSEYNFQQGLRDLAQAGQLSAANEAARNSVKLLEAQKQQAAIEQQKLQLDQIRLQEERARHEAARNKLERHKAIRNAMAEMERILQSFTRDLAAGRLNQIIGGLSLISFLGALTRRQLQMVTACKDELEDLSDIRFMSALQQSFADLVVAQPNELSASGLEKAASKLTEFAGWAGAYRTQYLKIEKDVEVLLESLTSSSEHQNTLVKIKSNLELTESTGRKVGEIDVALSQLWAGVEADIQALRSAEIGSEEICLLSGRELDPYYPELRIEVCEVRNRLDACKKILQKSEALWHLDRAFVDRGLKEIRAGNWGEAERVQEKIQRHDWTDFDAGQVENALLRELERLREEISGLKSRKERVSVAAAHVQMYAASPLISDALKKVYYKEISELAARSRKIRNTIVALTALGVLSITCYIISTIAAEKEKVAAAERAERERIEAAFLAEKIASEKAEEERVAAILREKRERAASERAEKEKVAAIERMERESSAASEQKEQKEQKEKALAEKNLLPNDTGRSLRFIPNGRFQMGSVNGNSDEKPVHQVSLSAFYMGETEVTYGEWQTLIIWAKARGYIFSSRGDGLSAQHPVTNVSWYDAIKWCNAKSQKDGLAPCYKASGVIYRNGRGDRVTCDWNANGYRLPTEAEWEKAARGGLVGKKFPNGDSLEKRDANIDGSCAVEVGRYPANGYGLYDMAGNVAEWCWDWHGSYSGDVDPSGPASGSYRVLRGGRWSFNADDSRSALRNGALPSTMSNNLGFRLARGRLPSGEAGSR